MIKRTIENGRFLVYIAVVASFIASLMTFALGAIRLVENGLAFVHGALEVYSGKAEHIPAEVGINMIAVVDAFLLGTILYIFAVGLYELFIGDLEVPMWLTIHSLDDLKAKLQSVIIMIMAVLFLEHLASWSRPLETLMFAGAIAIVTLALVFYSTSKSGKKSKGADAAADDIHTAPANVIGKEDAAALKLKKKKAEPVQADGDGSHT